jgi:hypothetical protein
LKLARRAADLGRQLVIRRTRQAPPASASRRPQKQKTSNIRRKSENQTVGMRLSSGFLPPGSSPPIFYLSIAFDYSPPVY